MSLRLPITGLVYELKIKRVDIHKTINMDNKKYYHLKKGDVIKEGDEVEVSSKYNDPAKWQKTRCAGGLAPDPQFMAHRKYRRLITEDN